MLQELTGSFFLLFLTFETSVTIDFTLFWICCTGLTRLTPGPATRHPPPVEDQTRTFDLHHTPIKRWYSPLPRKRRRQLSSRRRRSRWSWIRREKKKQKKKEKKENPSPAGTTVTDTLDKFNLFDLNGQGSQKYTAQLVKPVKGSVMPVKKKRKLPGADDHEHKCKITSFARPQIRGARPISSDKLFSSRKCLLWFHKYAAGDNVVDPEAMESFCEDIGVEPENIVMLVLAWHLEAANMGFFTKEEWLRGMTVLQCDCTERLQSKLEYMRGELNDSVLFKNIYRYAFDFSRDRDQRSLDMDTAKSMLALLLGRTWPLFPIFHQFLEQSKYKGMNKDQWYNVLEFSRTINTDLSNYDEDGAWPVLLDEFVEWQKTWSAS